MCQRCNSMRANLNVKQADLHRLAVRLANTNRPPKNAAEQIAQAKGEVAKAKQYRDDIFSQCEDTE